jgi:hypothetical protein
MFHREKEKNMHGLSSPAQENQTGSDQGEMVPLGCKSGRSRQPNVSTGVPPEGNPPGRRKRGRPRRSQTAPTLCPDTKPNPPSGSPNGQSGNPGPSHHASETVEQLASPATITRIILPGADPWQIAVAQAVRRPGRVAVRAANGVGKTKLISALICEYLATQPDSRVVITAGVYRQLSVLRDYLQQIVGKHFAGWQLKEQELIAPDGCKAVWYSAANPGLFEGQHAQNLLLILDEAKSIDPGIFLASERLQASHTLITSSTGPAIGPFYDCFTKYAHAYSCFQIKATDSSFVRTEWIEDQAKLYGSASDHYRSAVLAEFTESSEAAFIPLSIIQKAMTMPPPLVNAPPVAGIDLAASAHGDESVVSIRTGNRILPLVCFREADAMAVAGRCILELGKHNIPPGRVFADAGGLGGPIIDRMREMGWAINKVHFGSTPYDRFGPYDDRATEMWGTLRRQLEDWSLILPHDQTLIGQLSTREIRYTSSGKIKLKPKSGKSPDRADAVALSLNSPSPSPSMTKPWNTNSRDQQGRTKSCRGFYYGI